MKLLIYVDGASRGNPGPGAAGIVIKDNKGNILLEKGRFLGSCTNNHAEFSAFYLALRYAKKLDGTDLKIFSDSQLLTNQFNGIYKIRNPHLKDMMLKIRHSAECFKKLAVAHIPRKMNSEADGIANKVLDSAVVKSTLVKPVKTNSVNPVQQKLF